MANGRLKKEPGYCDYRFIDETYCKEKIAGEFLHESGNKVPRTGWEDKENRNYCLFHSHNDGKGEFFYPEIKNKINKTNNLVKKKLAELDRKQLSKLERKKQEGKIRNEHFIDFEGFYFPKNADFEGTVFEATVSFLKAEFGGEAVFIEAEFGGAAYFTEAEFSERAYFNDVEFFGITNFYRVMFHGEGDFWGVKLGGEAHFYGAEFNGVTRFSKAEFIRKACFYGAWFGSEVYFNDAKFKKEADFRVRIFRDVACFSNTQFYGEAYFGYTRDQEEANFIKESFKKGIIFTGVEFRGVADFRLSIFRKKVLFSKTSFNGKTDFSGATFLSELVDFSFTVFPGDMTFFHEVIFNCEVLFYWTVLKGVRFTGCYIGSASFYGSDVRDAVFINSSWNRRFLKKQIQNLIKQERIGKDTPVLEISKILSGGKRRAVLLDEYIYQYSKTTSIFEKIKIWLYFGFTSSCRGIKNFLKNFLKKQKGIPLSSYNLDPSRLELDPLYLEHLYCQFKLAMDRNKMYGLANDFYHGEKMMETKRLWEERSFPSFLKWAFLWLYRLLAGFGNSPWRAIISLILILFASSCLLIKFNGLNVIDSKEAFKRCPCKSEEKIKTVTTKLDPIQAAALAKVERSFISGDMAGLVVSLNTLDKFSKETKPGEIPGTGPPKVQTEYSLKCNYLCNVFFVSLWNLTAAPGGRSGYYRENGWGAYLAVFCIQYIFRPLMVALIIISVRRKVHRG